MKKDLFGKDLSGKLVFGFGGSVDMTPCIYRDKGRYKGTEEEYNVRAVEQVYLLDELRGNKLVNEIVSQGSYGCRWGGGESALYEITEEQAQVLIAENDKLVAAKKEEEERKEAEWKEKMESKEMRKDSLKCEILKFTKGYGGECGVDPSVLVRLTDPQTCESLEFVYRNIFDIGYVVNPNYAVAKDLKPGGLASNGKWQTFEAGKGWHDVRDLTDFEKRCLQYLDEFPPIYSGISI